ncbi:MAG: response regulator [Nitrospiraceae bacterium]|nr:response regulator [Nitrospiraceae bacterium]
MKTILAIDDEPSVRQSFRMMLEDRYRMLFAENGREGLAILDKHHVDLILLDLTMPYVSGMDFLAEMERRGEDVPVIVVTASNSVTSAVAAMKAGAYEYVIKPFEIDEVLLLVARTLAQHLEQNELTVLRQASASGFDALIGDSPTFLRAVQMARQAADVDSTVLITGESGTGKDMLARAIQSSGKRADHAYVALSCCAIPAQLFESELFGHGKGAFTGATERHLGKMQVADGGTLFLDEIGEMPLEAQPKLLRALQDGTFYPLGSTKSIEVDTRIICATNRNLPDEIRNGNFREDLFYRVNVLPIEMPPLRQRREDIPKLAAFFVAKHAPRVNSKIVTFEPGAMSMLMSYSWPGNVREMENTIERILVCNRDKAVITDECLLGILPNAAPEKASGLTEFEGLPIEEAVNRLERHLIERALERSGHVQSRAADLLGTTRRILKYKMDQLDIDNGGAREAEIA